MEAFFEKHGIQLSNPHGLESTAAFSTGSRPHDSYVQVWDPTSTLGEKRYILLAPATLRKRAAEGQPDISHVDFFCTKWRSYTAYVGQQIMRARHFALVGTSRKELVYIRRVKEFQDKSFAKILALAVTAGITFGQVRNTDTLRTLTSFQRTTHLSTTGSHRILY